MGSNSRYIGLRINMLKRNYKKKCICNKCEERINYKDYKIVKDGFDYHFNCGINPSRSSNDWIINVAKYSGVY